MVRLAANACRKNVRPARHWGSNGVRAGPDIREARRGNVDEAAPRGSVSVMAVEAMVMTEMLVVMPVMMMAVMADPSWHWRRTRPVDVARSLRHARSGPGVGHRGRHNKHGSRKQRGGNCLQHGRVPPEIARWPVGWPGSSIMPLNLMAAR